MHHHRILFDKYHPGYFGKVGMCYFHKLRNKLHCPIVNINKLWSLIPQEVKDKASKNSDVPRRREGREGTEEEKETFPEMLHDGPRRERETEKERGTETEKERDKERGARRRAEPRNTETSKTEETPRRTYREGPRRTESRKEGGERNREERRSNGKQTEKEKKLSRKQAKERERRRKGRKRRREGKWLATEQRASRGEEEEEVNALFGALETELNRGEERGAA